MKSPEVHRTLATSQALSQAHFRLDDSDASHIMSILRDKMYSDKLLAVLREYGANAWDAHKSVGREHVPFLVKLPTTLNSSLSIRDYGPGLSESDIFDVYISYGRSTKRDENNEIGSFGLGAKSAFAYTDTFTITSWHDGQKCIYSAAIDESNRGIMTTLYRGTCGPDESGIEVTVPIKKDDIPALRWRAARLFRWFKPMPVFAPKLDIDPLVEYFDGCCASSAPAVAVMGGIPYNSQELRRLLADAARKHLDLRLPSGVAIEFDIGELDISASRESLEYTPRTLESLKRKAVETINAAGQAIEVEIGGAGSWEKAMKTVELRNSPLGAWATNRLFCTDTAPKPDCLFIEKLSQPPAARYEPVTRRIDVRPGSIVVVFDKAPRKVRRSRVLVLKKAWDQHGGVGGDCFVMTAKERMTHDELEAVVDDWIARSGLTGIPVYYSSSPEFDDCLPPVRKRRKAPPYEVLTGFGAYGFRHTDGFIEKPEEGDVLCVDPDVQSAFTEARIISKVAAKDMPRVLLTKRRTLRENPACMTLEEWTQKTFEELTEEDLLELTGAVDLTGHDTRPSIGALKRTIEVRHDKLLHEFPGESFPLMEGLVEALKEDYERLTSVYLLTDSQRYLLKEFRKLFVPNHKGRGSTFDYIQRTYPTLKNGVVLRQLVSNPMSFADFVEQAELAYSYRRSR